MRMQVNRIFTIREKKFLVHVDMFAKRIYNIHMMFAKREYRKGGLRLKYPNIEAERARYGYSQAELSARIGVTTRTYQNWQGDKTEIPCSKVIAMAYMFNVSADYLLGIVKDGAS